jgi:hypothetical protein
MDITTAWIIIGLLVIGLLWLGQHAATRIKRLEDDNSQLREERNRLRDQVRR